MLKDLRLWRLPPIFPPTSSCLQSTSSRIAGTKAYNARVPLSGSTESERVAVVDEVIRETGAILVAPYDQPDIILGQGTAALELKKQVAALMKDVDTELDIKKDHPLDAVITPLGGGGLLAGTATYFSNIPSTHVFGAEPSFRGGDDGRRGLAAGSRIPTVSTVTIADGLRTPVGEINWTVISDRMKVRGAFAVTEYQIKDAMKLVLERMKLVIELSAAMPLAVVLFDEEF